MTTAEWLRKTHTKPSRDLRGFKFQRFNTPTVPKQDKDLIVSTQHGVSITERSTLTLEDVNNWLAQLKRSTK